MRDSHMSRITKVELHGVDSQTDWSRIASMTDDEITLAANSDSDALPLDDTFFAIARRLSPKSLLKKAKQQVTLRIDADVLEWFRALGPGHQSRMNAVLKSYAETHSEYHRLG